MSYLFALASEKCLMFFSARQVEFYGQTFHTAMSVLIKSKHGQLVSTFFVGKVLLKQDPKPAKICKYFCESSKVALIIKKNV